MAGEFWSEFRSVAKRRGIAGLYTGFVPAMVRAFPANAALFLGYEKTRQNLDRQGGSVRSSPPSFGLMWCSPPSQAFLRRSSSRMLRKRSERKNTSFALLAAIQFVP